jgi:hypothetical protein
MLGKDSFFAFGLATLFRDPVGPEHVCLVPFTFLDIHLTLGAAILAIARLLCPVSARSAR